LSDMYLTDSSRVHNNELVMKFVQDDSTLHFRIPSRMASPLLGDWLTAFRRVQSVQQERKRLGTAANLSDSESGTQQSMETWPGEDVQPAQRQRGSSLAVSISAPKQQDVNVDINNPYELGDFETKVKPQENKTTTSSQMPTSTDTTMDKKTMSSSSQQQQPFVSQQQKPIMTWDHPAPTKEEMQQQKQVMKTNKDDQSMVYPYATEPLNKSMPYQQPSTNYATTIKQSSSLQSTTSSNEPKAIIQVTPAVKSDQSTITKQATTTQDTSMNRQIIQS